MKKELLSFCISIDVGMRLFVGGCDITVGPNSWSLTVKKFDLSITTHQLQNIYEI